jgi:hypothetical protein
LERVTSSSALATLFDASERERDQLKRRIVSRGGGHGEDDATAHERRLAVAGERRAVLQEDAQYRGIVARRCAMDAGGDENRGENGRQFSTGHGKDKRSARGWQRQHDLSDAVRRVMWKTC